MSHYAVAVFSDDKDFDRLLAPYSESDESLFQFFPKTDEEIRESWNKFHEQNPKWTFEDFRNMNYKQRDGQWGYWYNPNAKWDWYSLGGKAYLFELRDGFHLVANPRKNDYLWREPDEEARHDAEDFWDSYIEGDDLPPNPPGLYRREYYLERFGTKEQYVKECETTVPYAFVTPDGVWHAPGDVGYFGMSDENADGMNRYLEEWNRFLDSDSNPYVSLVDCHI